MRRGFLIIHQNVTVNHPVAYLVRSSSVSEACLVHCCLLRVTPLFATMYPLQFTVSVMPRGVANTSRNRCGHYVEQCNATGARSRELESDERGTPPVHKQCIGTSRNTMSTLVKVVQSGSMHAQR